MKPTKKELRPYEHQVWYSVLNKILEPNNKQKSKGASQWSLLRESWDNCLTMNKIKMVQANKAHQERAGIGALKKKKRAQERVQANEA